MSLTVGTGPFGHRPFGVFNFELPRREGLLYFEGSPRRIRGVFAGETVVDSRHAKLLHEQRRLPLYYFPEDEVRMDLLRPSDSATHCPYKGTAAYWSVEVNGQTYEDLVWIYRTPLPESQKIAGLACFYNEKVDIYVDGHLTDRPRTPFS